MRWTRGVDVELFKPGPKEFLTLPRPIFVYMGRVAVEKNIEAFLALDLPGTKLVIGDGPARPSLQAKFPAAHFVGYKFGAELAAYLAATDVFVFPSRTDTFGLVLLEALACGVPVAAYPVTGPIDVIENGATGVLDEDLRAAALAALQLDPAHCRAFALAHTWEAATQQFVGNLQPREQRVGLKPDLQPEISVHLTLSAAVQTSARACASCASIFFPRARYESAIRRHADDCARGAFTDIDTALRAMFSACT